ncbi:MAG: hypothetical protein NWF06_01730 [Candidatus Bathyarchaeota archaeon]|nr:hypothetical protein [Candidatus Bathyarchaeum sp.]
MVDKKTALIIVAVVAVSCVVVATALFVFPDEANDLVSSIFSMFDFSGDSSGDGEGSSTVIIIEGDDDADYEPEDKVFPTDIDIAVSPSSVSMGGWVTGLLSSDGRDYRIYTEVTHRGAGLSETLSGIVADDDGTYELSRQMYLPGLWKFQTTAENGVVSNFAYLTVRGVQVDLEADHFSKTFRDSLELRVFCHYAGASVLFIANDPDASLSYSLGTATVNSGGYATLSYNFDSLGNGDYEIDAVVAGDSASAWSATAWLTVGR